MWPFPKKKKHIDEVTAFKYNDKLYPNLHAMLCAKEHDRKSEAKKALKDVLYYLAVSKESYNRLDEFEKSQTNYYIERDFVFRGEMNLNKLSDLLIEHWPYIISSINDHQKSKRLREDNEL